VTRRARAWERGDAERVVDAAHVGDREATRVEDVLSSRDRLASIGVRVPPGTGQILPGIEQGERPLIEPRAQHVVDADVERLPGQRHRATGSALHIQDARGGVRGLRRKEAGLELHDRVPLGRGQRIDPGRMAQRGAVGLVAQIEMNRLTGEGLAAVPHDGGEKR
jgi:hypothetical protein